MSSFRSYVSRSSSRRAMLALCATLALAGAAAAQASTAQADTTFPESAFDTSASSAVVARPSNALPLLPQRLGPIESVLWSEHGLARKTFGLDLNPQERDKELRVRHAMLQVHQVGGFVTMAGLIATVTLGQMAYNGYEVGGVHGAVAIATVASYFTTAGLSLLAPPPAIRRDEWSTVSTHKLLGAVHFTGMMITPILGSFVEDHRAIRPYHLGAAYATTAAYAGALLVVTL